MYACEWGCGEERCRLHDTTVEDLLGSLDEEERQARPFRMTQAFLAVIHFPFSHVVIPTSLSFSVG